jgi:allantoin racemase
VARIRVIVPVSSAMWNAPVQALMEGHKEPDTQIEVLNVSKGPESLECTYDETMVEMFTVLAAEEAEADGCDGVIIYCVSDPGLRAAKEKLSIPVVGIGEAAYHVASLLGNAFSVVAASSTDLASTQRRRVYDHLRVYALEHTCASVRSVTVPVLDLERRKGLQEKQLLAEACKAVNEDGADTIVLGCGGMLGVGETVSKDLGVPVIVPGIAGLKICEALIRSGLSQSKRCFGTPPQDKGGIVCGSS